MADIDVTSTSTSTGTVDLVGLNDIKADVKLELPQPFKTDSDYTYDIKPLRTDSSLAVDLKPAVIDLCLTLNVGKVPSVCIRQPYRHEVGFTLYGVKVWGFSFSGEQETVVEELGSRPQVAPSGGAVWPPAHSAGLIKVEPGATAGGGLRIRLGP